MNITISPPPVPSGSTQKDIEALSAWCGTLRAQLRRVLFSLDGENIASLPYARLTDIPNAAETSEAESM